MEPAMKQIHKIVKEYSQTPKKFETMMDILFTNKERDDVMKRIQILNLLNSGTPQRAISKELGVGIATVSRGAKVLAGMKPKDKDAMLK